MPDWVEKSLGSVFKVKHGFAFKGEYFTDSQQPHALVTPGNFSIGGGFQSQKQKYYSGPIPSEYVLDPGSVVVTMTDLSKQSDTLGYAALIPDDGITWLHNQRVGLLQFHDLDQADPVFFSYLMRTQAYRAWVVGSATGTTVKHTAPSRIESFRCLVPPVEQQRRIASVLKSLDDKIDLNYRINQSLEAMAQAIFKSWFVDFDPVKAKIAAKAEGRDPLRAAMIAISGKPDAELDTLPPDQFASLATTAALFPDEMEDSELGELPQGWTYRSLSRMVNLIGGGTPKRSEASFWNGSIPWFSVKDAPADGDVFVIATEEHISEEGLRKSSTRLLAEGVTIISARGTVGKLALVGTPMAMNQSCYGVQGAQGIGPYFNFFNLKTAIDTLKQNTHGAVFDTITQSTFDTVISVCPKQEERDAFEALVTPFLRRIRNNLKETKSLVEIRDALLPKLLSGELVVHTPTSVAVPVGG